MNSTVLRFDGGAIPAGGGASSDRAIHHLFLRELTITELGQEVSVYALLDLDRPTLVAPNYEPVSAFTLFDWCSRGDVLQVDVAEALETGTNTYSAFFESANVATNNDGSYVDECIIRVDTKLSGTTPQIKTRYLRLSQKVDESTSVVYLCQLTSVDDHVNYPDFKVKITGLSTEQAGLLPIKIRGDGETIGVEVIRQNPLGDPIDPFLRIKSLSNFFVAKYGETTYAEVREALIHNKETICAKDHKVYTYRYISNSVYEFSGSVASDGTFEVVKVSSPDVWTTELHNVKEFSVYRKSFDNLNPASAVLTATDISRGYIDFDLDLGFPGGTIGSCCGEPTIIIGIPGRPWLGSGKFMLNEVFTKIILYTKTNDAYNYIATGVGSLNYTDDGRAVLDGNVTWNRMFTGIGVSVLDLQGFTARCYLNMNSGIEWTAGLLVEFYIHFTVIL